MALDLVLEFKFSSTLIFLCMFHGEKIKNLDKTEISKKLGADVPIFLEQKSGFASGVGEVFEKEHSFKSKYLIISPNFNISTKISTIQNFFKQIASR